MGPLCHRTTDDTINQLLRNTDHFSAESPHIAQPTAENDLVPGLQRRVDVRAESHDCEREQAQKAHKGRAVRPGRLRQEDQSSGTSRNLDACPFVVCFLFQIRKVGAARFELATSCSQIVSETPPKSLFFPGFTLILLSSAGFANGSEQLRLFPRNRGIRLGKSGSLPTLPRVAPYPSRLRRRHT